MHQKIESFINQHQDIPYKFEHGPWIFRDPAIEISLGINCISLVHLFYQEILGATLPTGLWAKEIFSDKEFLEEIFSHENNSKYPAFKIGDIFLFGSKTNDVEKAPHLAILTNTGQDVKPDPILIHTSPYSNKKGLKSWQLSDFLARKRYPELLKVKRLKTSLL